MANTPIKMSLTTVNTVVNSLTLNIRKLLSIQMAVRMSACSQESLEMLQSRTELLQLLCDEAKNDEDILAQLNALEMLKDLALTTHGFRYLERQGVLDKLRSLLADISSNPLSNLLMPGKENSLV